MKEAVGAIKDCFQSWVSPQSGPIEYTWCTSLGWPDPNWWVYGALLARGPLRTYWSPTHFSAAGASIQRGEAFSRAIGEALERHASVHAIDEDREVKIPFGETRLAGRFAKCASTEVCPPMFRGENWDVPIGHVRIEVAASAETTLIPTPYVHMGCTVPTEDLLATYPISTGVAFSTVRSSALWSALCEVVERDAIMLFWLTRSHFRTILVDPKLDPLRLATRIRRISDVGLDCYLVDISTDVGMPTVLAIVRGSEFPYMTVGACCHSDAVTACCKALDEAVSVRYVLRNDRWRREIPSYTEFSWVRRLEDHMILYGLWRDPPLQDFFAEAQSVPLRNYSEEFAAAIPRSEFGFQAFARQLRAELGLTVLARDLVCLDTAPYGHVVRVVVPEMMPLSQNHNAQWLETPRLVRRMGGRQLNTAPHPFA